MKASNFSDAQKAFIIKQSEDGTPVAEICRKAGIRSAECLNQHWFLTLADAAEKLEAWRRYYNEERPHGSTGNMVPVMLTKSGGVTSPSP